MKKLVLGLAAVLSAALLVSCASKKAAPVEEEDPFAMFTEEEEEGPTWEPTKEKLTNASCNTLAADTGVGVTIVVDKDISKGGTALQGAEVEVVNFLGEKCLKVTPNFNSEIRIAFVFDKPITLEQFSKIKFDVAAGCENGNGGFGVYNGAIMYAEKEDEDGEFPMCFYGTDCSSTEWLGGEWDLENEGQWGSSLDKTKTVQAIQFWSGIKGPLFIKNLSLVK